MIDALIKRFSVTYKCYEMYEIVANASLTFPDEYSLTLVHWHIKLVPSHQVKEANLCYKIPQINQSL